MSRGDDSWTLTAKGEGARQCIHSTLEGDGEDFKVDSLFNCEPVKLLEVLSNVRPRMEVEDSTKSKVLYSLELSQVGQGYVKEKRVTLVEF